MNRRRLHVVALAPVALLAALALGGPAHAGGPLGLTNGSFESGGPAPFTISTPGWGQWLGPAGEGSNYGIALTSTPPDVAQDGSGYAYFHANQSITDCIGEQLNTVVGQAYTVSFWMATDGPTDAQTSLLQVVWGPDFSVTSNDVFNNVYQATSSLPVPYQHVTLTFTAVTTHDILAFHGYDATSNILLDDVTVASVSAAPATPAASPWHLLLLAAMLVGGAFYALRGGEGQRGAHSFV
jgi:hypothetical protein